MSHDADSVLARQHPALNLCDLYVFDGTAGKTALAQTLYPLAGTGSRFYPGGQYCFHLSRGGDARADLTYRVVFREHEGSQLFELRSLDGAAAADRHAPGTVMASGLITEALYEGLGGIRVWAGAAGDPQWEHGMVLDAARQCIAEGRRFEPHV